MSLLSMAHTLVTTGSMFNQSTSVSVFFLWCRTPRMSGQWRHHWLTYPVHLKSSPPRKPCLKPERHGARVLLRERAARWDHPLGPIFFSQYKNAESSQHKLKWFIKLYIFIWHHTSPVIHLTQDTEGLKVGVANLITHWVRGPSDDSRQPSCRPTVSLQHVSLLWTKKVQQQTASSFAENNFSTFLGMWEH